MSRSLQSAGVLLAASLSWACDRVPSGATLVSSLQVSEGNLASAPELGISAEQVRRALQRSLEGTGRFAVREKASGKGARVRLEVELARRLLAPPPPSGALGALAAQFDKEQAEVVVSLELLLPAKKGELERLVAEGGARRLTGAEAASGPDPEALQAAFEAALEGATHEAALALAFQLESRRKSDAELLKDLVATDPRLRDYAVRALADRRNRSAVPALLERLKDDSPAVVRRAMGALVAIGDQRAVRPLIELTRKRPPAFVSEVVYAIGSLGGVEAEAFLFTIESGATEEEVRRSAHEAYEELRKKREETAPPTAAQTPPGRP